MNRLIGLILLHVWLMEYSLSKAEVRKALCGVPGATSTSEFHPNNRTFFLEGEEVQYSCKRTSCRATDESAFLRRCLQNGTWSGKMLVCNCPLNSKSVVKFRQSTIYQGRNASLAFDGLHDTCYMSQTEYVPYWEASLSSSFRISGVSVRLSASEDDTEIKILTKQGNSAENLCGSIRINLIQNSTITIMCDRSAIGEFLRVAMRHATSSTLTVHMTLCELTIFTPPDCQSPDSPLDGWKQRFSGPPSKYTFHCHSGFTLEGHQDVICQTDGTWSPSSPICKKKIECTRSPLIPHGIGVLIDNLKWEYGAGLQILCNPGYIAIAPNLRRCSKDATWGNVDICVEHKCDDFPSELRGFGEWCPINGSNLIRVLVCDPGYYIEGSPAVTQCLVNGSWSLTTAMCRKIPLIDEWRNEWYPNTIMLAAVAIGVATAICVLCFVLCCLLIKKRKRSSTNTSVFHVGLRNSGILDRAKEPPFYTTNAYEDVIELRNNPSCNNTHIHNAETLRLPLETDPVYAQPFETDSKKLSPICEHRDEGYSTSHIYAEPVDSYRPASERYNFGGAETWFRTGATKFGQKMSLPERFSTLGSPTSHTSLENYRPMSHSPNLSAVNRILSEKFQKHHSKLEKSDTFTELISNAIYLDNDEGRFSAKDSDEVQMIDNDIYQDDYYSSV